MKLYYSLLISLIIVPQVGAHSTDRNLYVLYVELLKKSLVNEFYDTACKEACESACTQATGQEFHYALNSPFPRLAITMVGFDRLTQLQECIEDVLHQNIPGDFIETGVWRGGASIFMRALLKAHGVTTRTVWVADSFNGFPLYPAVESTVPLSFATDEQLASFLSTFSELAVPLEQVQENFKKYDLLDQQVRFLPGFFADTLPQAPIEKLAILRLDGDLYDSTMQALTSLYPKLSVGGYVIIDDAGLQTCDKAVADYRAAHAIAEPLIVDKTGLVYWKKSAPGH